MPYDPTLRGLIGRTDDDWGSPEENLQGLISFGIPQFDKAMYGINFRIGELLGIQSENKQRKTTFALNLAYQVAAHKRFWVCFDTLEAGMNPIACRDALIAMATTRKIIADAFGYDRSKWPSYGEIVKQVGHELEISKEFLWYHSRSPVQEQAIESAKTVLSKLPLAIFGAHPDEGKTNHLPSVLKRWDTLYHGKYPSAPYPFRFFLTDTIQLFEGYDLNTFEQMGRIVGGSSSFVTSHPGSVVLMVSQVSVTSTRLAKQNIGERMARGGAKLGDDVNVLMETEYDGDACPHKMYIRVSRTRRRPPPEVVQELDPDSGAFLRPAYRRKSFGQR